MDERITNEIEKAAERLNMSVEETDFLKIIQKIYHYLMMGDYIKVGLFQLLN